MDDLDKLILINNECGGIIDFNEYFHLWDIESLVLVAGFYCLSTSIRPLVLVHYSLAISGIEYLLRLHPSLMSVHYALHWIEFNSSIEMDVLDKLTLISNECGGIIDFDGLLSVGLSTMLFPIWHVNRY